MAQFKRKFHATARAALAVLAICLVSGQAWAESARAWFLETQTGQVHLVKAGISPIALTPGDVFAEGDWIETGPDGRAVLRRGEETIVVAPNSRIGLPKDNAGPFATRILHTLGTILLTVEKRAKQHFEVQTPYLTAVVKGTTFTVGIQRGRSVVHVVEGLVQVKNLASGRSSLVRPGQTGAVVRGGAADVQVEGGTPQGAPADNAASPAPSVTEAASQAAAQPAAQPVNQAASRTTVEKTTALRAAGTPGSAGVVKITQALGPKTLDLSRSTNGLIRAASRAAPQAAIGKHLDTDSAGNAVVMDARAQDGKGTALDLRGGVKPGLSKALGNDPARGQIASANAGLPNAGGGLALGQAVGANPGLPNAGGGLVLSQAVGANPGLPNAGGGLALGQADSANPGLVSAGGTGLALGRDASAHAGLGNAVGNGEGGGK